MKNNLVGKKVLVTGADGFIGSHLVERLLQEGAIVRALVQYNSLGKWGLLENVNNINKHKNLKVVLGDINDTHFCLDLVKDQEIVFHLAALIDIPYSYIAPESYFKTNVLGTINLLEAARKLSVDKFIHTSTSEVYGTALYSPIDEKHPLQAQSPYAASKVGADKAVISYYLSFGLPVVIVRPFNNFGPRQSARGVIPTIITQLLSNDIKNVKLGSLKPVRDYVFVTDTVDAFIKVALSEGSVGEVFNIGRGKGYSIEEIFNILLKLTNIAKTLKADIQRVRPEKSEVWELICDNTKIISLVDWKPSVIFEEGLKKTISWIKNNMDQYKPSFYNI